MKTIDKTFGFKLNDLFKNYKIKQKDAAEKCEITTSSLNKILNRESEHFFESILALVQYLVNLDECFEEEEELMRAYIQEIQDSFDIKMAMEYCDTHDMREMLEILCDRADLKANDENHLEEFSAMYRLNMERKDQQNQKNVSKELFNKIISQKNKTEEMQIFQ